MRIPRLISGALLMWLSLASLAHAQWDPPNGDWGKTDPLDVRVMTWNVRDSIRSGASKIESDNNAWAACAHIVAALRPDVLILQETGDNSGFGGNLDGVSTLSIVVDYFLHGGNDVFNGNAPITAYVQSYAPGYDLPFVFVSNADDGFNRNIILSRFPFADLNGDNLSTISDIPVITADAYAPGGDGGIRGFAFAELDLTDTLYQGDLVVGNAHLKSGGSASDLDQRLEAAQNVAYYVDYLYNGAGTGTPDPNNRIAGAQPTMILDSVTPVILGGDLNEDEQTNGRVGPADWLAKAEPLIGTDGTDRDRSASTIDTATHPFNGSWRCTQGSCSTVASGKLDYLIFQDSIATARRTFLFDNDGVVPTTGYPPEITSYGNPNDVSDDASDHRPVVVDLILPLVPITGGACCDTGGACFDGVLEGNCLAGGGFYQGDATVCAGVNCSAIGACCSAGVCSDGFTAGQCTSQGGTYQGDAVDCIDVTCPAPCLDDADCNDADACTRDRCNFITDCSNTRTLYGDLDGSGAVNLTDILCAVDGFGGTFSAACQFGDVDIAPCTPDGVITADDILAVVDAFAGVDPCCGATGTGACCDGAMCFDGVLAKNCLAGGGDFRGNGSTCAVEGCDGGTPEVRINEIDYDQPGTDTAEFIELFGTPGTSVAGWTVTLYNGSTGAAYSTIALSGSLPGDGYLVICGDAGTTANCDVDVTPNADLVQNGPDAVVLCDAQGTVVDHAGYEGSFVAAGGCAGGTSFQNEGSESGSGSMQRCPNGTGSFLVQFTITPGTANSCP